MSNFAISFLAGIGVGGWCYGKFMRKTGNNTRNSMIAVVSIGLFSFLILWAILNAIMPK